MTGEPIMRTVTLTGLNQNPCVESGIDFVKELIGDAKDDFGEGKALPTGPVCVFKGKRVPYFVRWSEKGGTTSTILTNILREMDER